MVTEVRATDAAGHVSEVVVSDGLVIDKTGPLRENKTVFDENIVINPSFETAEDFISINNLSLNNQCSELPLAGWDVERNTCYLRVKSEIRAAQKGKFFVIISGVVQQLLSGIEIREFYRVTVHTSHIAFDSATKSVKTCFISVNGDQQIFLLYSKPYRLDVKRDITTIAWHKHTFYFHSNKDTALLQIGTVGGTNGLAIDDVSVQKITNTSEKPASEEGHIQVHSVFVHDWSSIHASWSFLDPESSVKEYLWAIGKCQGQSKCLKHRSFTAE